MAVIVSTGKERNVFAVMRRVIDSCWFGTTNNAEQPPLALNNENILAVNAAGTGTVGLIKADGANMVTVAGNRLLLNPTAKTIVDGSATSLFDVSVPDNTMAGGFIFYTVRASDGTDFQALTGMVSYSAVSKAGTLTATNATEVAGNQNKSVSSGTLTLAWTSVTGAAKITIKLQPTGSLTETTPYDVTYTVVPLIGTVTIL